MGFGCVALTHQPTRRHAIRLLESAWESGIRYFDTAPSYGSGYSEALLGDFAQNHRQEIKIATKVGGFVPPLRIPPALALPLHALRRKIRSTMRPISKVDNHSEAQLIEPWPMNREFVAASVEGSLQRMQVDRIDVLLLHEALPTFLTPDAREYLFDLKNRGIVNELGVAANGVNYFSLSSADLNGWDVLQYEYGNRWEKHRKLPDLFPEQRHVFHSSLRDFSPQPESSIGHHFASILTSHKNSSILFSTRSSQRVRANVKETAEAVSSDDANSYPSHAAD